MVVVISSQVATLILELRVVDQLHVEFGSWATALLLQINLVQAVHDVFVWPVALLKPVLTVKWASVGVIGAVIFSDSLCTLAFIVRNLHAAEYLLFNDVDDLGDYRCSQLFRVNLCLLNMFSSKDQLESILHL